jgi:O-antigen/teichoic acid export membrane protein
MQSNWFHSALGKIIPPSFLRIIERHPSLLKILNNVRWLFFDRIIRMGLGLLVGVWVAKYLGPEEFGQMSYVTAFVGLFGSIALGFNGIIQRDIIRDPQSVNTLVSTAFFLQAIAGIVGMLLAIATISLLKSNDQLTYYLVIILSVSLIFKSTDVIRYWFEAHVQSRYVVWIENGVFLLMALCRLALILMKSELITFIWMIFVETVLVYIGLIWIYVLRNGTLSILFQVSKKRAKSLLKESWPLMLSGIAITLYMRLDMVMLEGMSNSREVGIYAAATRISELCYVIPVIFISSVSPAIIASHSKDPALYLKRLKILYFIMAWLAIGVSLPIAFLSGPIVSLIYGVQYQDAAPVLAIHLWGSVGVFLGVASSQHLLVEHLQKISLYRTLIGVTCNIILNLLLIPSMGAKGAAIATVISYFLATFSLIFFKATQKHAIHLLMSPIVWK